MDFVSTIVPSVSLQWCLPISNHQSAEANCLVVAAVFWVLEHSLMRRHDALD
jgi:hypothetical protein|tara:strand:- start:283 stop:438 length:156 start_codon:yes stop_codon:yes gene_type:complete